MASIFRRPSVIVVFIAAVFLAGAVNSIPVGEFNSMLETLRFRGYDLFCNAIVTSDLQLDLLFARNDTVYRSYTLFAPTDSSLFALDMTETASSYTDSLRFHVVRRRLAVDDLLRLSDGSSLPTLLSNRYLNVTRRPDSGSVAVNGVDIVFPDLFRGSHVVVHGLAGIITLRSDPATGVVSGSPVSSSDSSSLTSFPPRTGSGQSENSPAVSPVDSISPVNRYASAPATESTSPFSRFPAVHGVSLASSTASVSRHSTKSTPPLENSDAAVPVALDRDMWLPEKHDVPLIETIADDSKRMIETHRLSDELPEKSPPLMDGQEKILDKREEM